MEHVEAAKSLNKINEIDRLLRKHKGDLFGDIWKFGINVGLRISDQLGIKFDDLEGDRLVLIEGKTKKRRSIQLNSGAMAVVARRRAQWPHDTYVFQVHSNRSSGKPVSRESVSRAFKEIGEIVGVKLGTHSLRKTRGWAMYDAGVPIEKISKTLNHASPGVTMRYIGIEQADLDKISVDLVL